MDYISPFDIKKVFLDTLLGSAEILSFSIIILISILSAKFNISNNNFLLLLVISSIIMSGFLGQAMYIIILVVVGFVVFKSMARSIQ